MILKDHYYPNTDIKNIPEVFNPRYTKWSPAKSAASPLVDATEFRQGLGKFPYIGWTRHDIKPAISFLSTNMQHPTQLDLDFCRYLAAYLITTIFIGLCFHPSTDDLGLFLSNASDAAFDVYLDSKSQLAVWSKLGLIDDPSNAVLTSSKKEKAITTTRKATRNHGSHFTIQQKKFSRHVHHTIDIHHVHCQPCIQDITKYNTFNNNNNNNNNSELPSFVPKRSVRQRPTQINWCHHTTTY